MISKLQSDQFYITYKTRTYYGSKKEYHFSIAGLMFLSELIYAGIEAAGIDTLKVSIRVEKNEEKPTLAVSFPSPKSRFIHTIKIVDNYIVMTNNKADPTKKKRRDSYGYLIQPKRETRKFLLADPALTQNIAAFMKSSLPKTSKFFAAAVESVPTSDVK